MASTPSSDFSIRHAAIPGAKALDGATVIELRDRRLVDALHIENLGEQIKDIINATAAPKLILSFARVEYVSSTMLNVLIEIDNLIKRKGGQLRLTNLEPELQKVISIMKLHKVLKIYDTIDEALKSLAKAHI